VSATSPTTIPRESVLSDNTPEGLPPLADLSEALARGREPRRLWTVLHAIEDTTQRPPGWWESWPALWLFMALLVIVASALAKC
jgi:hypothetical protein